MKQKLYTVFSMLLLTWIHSPVLLSAQDECSSKVSVPVNAECILTSYNFSGATPSGMNLVEFDSEPENDVFIEFSAYSADGTWLTFGQSGANVIVYTIYSGTCSSMSQISWLPMLPNSSVNLTGLTPESSYIIRIWAFNGHQLNSTEIGIHDEILATILPLELISFTERELANANELTCQTAQEHGVDYIALMKSYDGLTWAELTRAPANNTITPSEYTFYDYSPYAVTYYKLHLVDVDGSVELSNIISVTNKQVLYEKLLVYSSGNVTNQLDIQINSSSDQHLEMYVYSALGQVVRRLPLDLYAGQQRTSIYVGDLPAGRYMISCLHEQYPSKLFIKHGY